MTEMTDLEEPDQVEKGKRRKKQCSSKQQDSRITLKEEEIETTKVTIGTEIRKEIVSLLLRIISLQMSMNIEMNSTTQMELPRTEDLL